MTNREKVVVMAYTGFCTLTGDKLDLYYQYLEELFGRPVFTHEIPSLIEEIQERAKPDFIEICKKEEEEIKPKPSTFYQVGLLGDNTILPFRFESYQEAKAYILKNHLLDGYIVIKKV